MGVECCIHMHGEESEREKRLFLPPAVPSPKSSLFVPFFIMSSHSVHTLSVAGYPVTRPSRYAMRLVWSVIISPSLTHSLSLSLCVCVCVCVCAVIPSLDMDPPVLPCDVPPLHVQVRWRANTTCG